MSAFEHMNESWSIICSFRIRADAILVESVGDPVDLGIVGFRGCRIIIKIKGVVPVDLWI